jgi:hypothetical protein
MPTGHLSTFSFATVAGAGTSLNIISITPPEETVSDIATPYLSLAKGSGIPYEPGELFENHEYDIEVADDNNTQIVDTTGSNAGTFKNILRVLGTCVYTKPAVSPNTNGATRTFSGYIKSQQEGQAVTGQRSTIKLKVKVAGTVTRAAGS